MVILRINDRSFWLLYLLNTFIKVSCLKSVSPSKNIAHAAAPVDFAIFPLYLAGAQIYSRSSKFIFPQWVACGHFGLIADLIPLFRWVITITAICLLLSFPILVGVIPILLTDHTLNSPFYDVKGRRVSYFIPIFILVFRQS